MHKSVGVEEILLVGSCGINVVMNLELQNSMQTWMKIDGSSPAKSLKGAWCRSVAIPHS